MALATAVIALSARADVLRVLVVDDQGQPAVGVPVSVRPEKNDAPSYESRVTTRAPDGIAEFENAERWYTPDAQSYHIVVQPMVPLAQALTMPLAGDHSPADPMRLQLPPCGTLVVHVRGRFGEDTVPDGSDLWMWWKDPVLGWSGGQNRIISGTQRDVRFTYVGIGAELRVEAVWGRHRLPRDVPARVRAPGEAAEFTLELSDRVLTGKLLGPQGEPMNRTLDVQVGALSGNGARLSRSLVVKDGAFEFSLRDPSQAAGGARELDVQHPLLLSARVDKNFLRASATPGPFDPENRSSLGDLHLVVQEAVATGKVRGPEGLPLASAELRIVSQRDAKPVLESICGTRRVDAQGAIRFEAAQPDLWRFDADGRYLAREGEHAWLVVANDPLLPAMIELGAKPLRDLDVVLAKGSDVTGRLLLDAGIDASANIAIELDYSEPPLLAVLMFGASVHARGPGMRSDGSFHWDSLPPGEVAVRVKRVSDKSVLFERKGSKLPADAAALSAALAQIDVRGKLR
jgi:hypothetical protein